MIIMMRLAVAHGSMERSHFGRGDRSQRAGERMGFRAQHDRRAILPDRRDHRASRDKRIHPQRSEDECQQRPAARGHQMTQARHV